MEWRNYYIYCLASLAFFIPVWPLILPILIVCSVLLRLKVGWDKLNNTRLLFLFLFAGIYVFYLLGLLYTEDLQRGFSDIETKLSILLFPVLFFTHEPFKIEERNKILIWFLYGCLFAVFLNIANSIFQFFYTKYLIANGDKEVWDYGFHFFFKERISPMLHTSYIAMYLVFGLIIAFFLRKDLKNNKKLMVLIYLLFPLLICLFISKSGILSLLIWLLILGVYYIIKEKAYKKVLLIAVLAIVSTFAMVKFVPEFGNRFAEMKNVVLGDKNQDEKSQSSGVRKNVWGISINLIKENSIYGVGTGDVKKVLLAEYEKNGLQNELEHEYNCHNQYLQTGLALGVPGMLLFILLLLIPAFYAFKIKDYLYLSFILLFAWNVFVESMFETQAGVIFFAFINSLLYCTVKSNHNHASIFSTKN